MSQNEMLKFVTCSQAMPPKRSADKRRQDFGEIYGEYSDKVASEQAGRCSQCGVPFCQIHCPLGNNIPDWLLLTQQGRLREAYMLSSATNTFPEICGRICPQDKLCEGSCVIEQSGHGTVSIGTIEKYITETAWDNGWVEPIRPAQERSQSVAVIGAGPAGLAAAERLRMEGYAVSVYDRYDRVGGLLTYGIPNFKLDKNVVQRRANWLVDGGICFHLNCDVGKDIGFAELRQQHNAVLIAVGVYQARQLHRDAKDFTAKGLDKGGILQALDYLTFSNRRGLGDKLPSHEARLHDLHGKHVVVIGGGDTAMDCVRTAVRQGAKSVKCLYRRDSDNMPGSAREVKHAQEEGVEFCWLTLPQRFIGGDNIGALEVTGMRLGSVGIDGRRQVFAVEDGDYQILADTAIMALGFDAEDLRAHFDSADLPLTRWGTVQCYNALGCTDMDGVFAAGDIVRGASLVVWAIRDGRTVADAIHRYLQRKQLIQAIAAA